MATIYRLVTALGATLAILAVYSTSVSLPVQQANDGNQVQQALSSGSAPIGLATSNPIDSMSRL